MHQIDATALRDLVAAQPADRPALLLDVREPWETALGMIDLAGAVRVAMPMNGIPDRLGELDRQQLTVCICHHGMRSAQVASYLEQQGFKAIVNLIGGTDAWSTQVDDRLPRY